MTWFSDLQQSSAKLLAPEVMQFVCGGADDEAALRANIESFERLFLIPRVLRDVSDVSTEIKLINQQLVSPILIAPTAPHKLVHKQGELATVKAAAETNTLMIVSCMATYSLEDIAKASDAQLWLQLHIFRDRQITANLIKRAELSGYLALVVTVDMPVMGNRLHDVKNQFRIPDDCLAANLIAEGVLDGNAGKFSFKNPHANNLFAANATWDDIEWMKQQTSLPILLKGILHPEDARLAVKLGVDGIIASNHGARQCGATIPPLCMLRELFDLLQGRLPLLMDGGIRSGNDVLKALFAGANAVLIGRPILFGLTVGGQYGVSGVLNQLQRELEQAMKLCGIPQLSTMERSSSFLSIRSF